MRQRAGSSAGQEPAARPSRRESEPPTSAPPRRRIACPTPKSWITARRRTSCPSDARCSSASASGGSWRSSPPRRPQAAARARGPPGTGRRDRCPGFDPRMPKRSNRLIEVRSFGDDAQASEDTALRRPGRRRSKVARRPRSGGHQPARARLPGLQRGLHLTDRAGERIPSLQVMRELAGRVGISEAELAYGHERMDPAVSRAVRAVEAAEERRRGERRRTCLPGALPRSISCGTGARHGLTRDS